MGATSQSGARRAAGGRRAAATASAAGGARAPGGGEAGGWVPGLRAASEAPRAGARLLAGLGSILSVAGAALVDDSTQGCLQSPPVERRPHCTQPPREGERNTPFPVFLLPDPPCSSSSALPPRAGSAASIFQIFLEAAAPQAAVARALTEAAEAEVGRSLGRGAAARAPPRRPSAQAQTPVTAGWWRPNRSGDRPRRRRLRRGGLHFLRGCSTRRYRLNA